MFFRQGLKSNAFYADEVINIYLLRPIAAVIVWVLYGTPVTPNQVTVFAVLLGLGSAVAFAVHTPVSLVWAGVLIIAKDIFDDADGQLARAKQQYSRRGRFLDSIGDFVVDVAVFAGMSIAGSTYFGWPLASLLAGAGCLGTTLRVSYHVFYQVSFLHLENKYQLNRIIEEETDDDRNGDPVALELQRVFNHIYGWQDRLMLRIDRWCKGRNFRKEVNPTWYGDRFALRLSGFMGFGTELTILGVCAITGNIAAYLLLNVLLLNLVWLANVLYRKFILAPNVK